jgi:uncharacterized protein (DUF2141 family)
LISCAKRGSISGGLKDTIAPVLKISFPKNYSTDFNGKSIKLTFDEYIKLKDLNKQLIISPPIAKKPQILPTTASKYLTINFLDTLQPNTTYSLNFGQSIEDNNEGNPYRQFKYVFSTGHHIDSLSLSGRIKDAYNKKTESFVSVMLYEINDKYTDSIVYKENPRYVTNTLDSAKTFKLENLKAGKYLLVALKDINNDYRFNPKIEKIGFRKEYITLPNDTLYEVELFKEEQKFKAFKPAQSSGNSLTMGFEGNPKDAKISLRKGTENLTTILTKVPKKDSLQLWYKPIKIDKSVGLDSLQLSVLKGKYTQDFSFKIKNQKIDSLKITAVQSGVLNLNEKFTLNSSTPLSKIDASKMQLLTKDSIVVAFKTEYDELNRALTFDFQKEPLEKYKLKIMPGALTDFLDQTNTNLVYKFDTKNVSDYGNLRLNIENIKHFPIIVELTNKAGEVQNSYYSESSSQIDFSLIKPELYTLRVIYDENKNKVWDSGNFLEKRQSEEVIYFAKEIDVRANWDVQQTFNLKP